VEIMMDFMGGKAGQFFMKHVALRRKDWTVKCCFPPNFKLQLHEKLMSATQRHSNFRDFMCSIMDLAMRFLNGTELRLRRIFWDGIEQKLRMYLMRKGQDL
ncbi:hypothetical protein K438DRAFT_1594068, partial [Mycena galopus ATCC 62051]